jgi:hypothetical protein
LDQSELADRDRFFLLGPAGRRWSNGHEQGCHDEQHQDSLAEALAIAAPARTPR